MKKTHAHAMANPVVSGYIQFAEPLAKTATWPEIGFFFYLFLFNKSGHEQHFAILATEFIRRKYVGLDNMTVVM